MTCPDYIYPIDVHGESSNHGVDLLEGFRASFKSRHGGYAYMTPALLPFAISRRAADEIWAVTQECLCALRTVLRGEIDSAPAEFLSTLGYSESDSCWLMSMLNPPNMATAAALARADFVLSAEGPRLVEINVGPALGGIGIIDRYADLLESALASPASADTPGRMRGLPATRSIHALAQTLRELARCKDERIRVALVIADDEAEFPNAYEIAAYLTNEGVDSDVVRIDEIVVDSRASYTGSGPVDLIYGCFTFGKLVNPRYRKFANDALSAQASGGPSYLSPPLFSLLGNKALLALAGEAMPRQVQKTTVLDGAALEGAMARKDRLVLKPAIGYGGEDVAIGAGCSAETWEISLNRATAAGRRYVLQEYVEPAPLEFLVAGETLRREVVLGCLSLGGRFAGYFIRHLPAGTGEPINTNLGATFGGAAIMAN